MAVTVTQSLSHITSPRSSCKHLHGQRRPRRTNVHAPMTHTDIASTGPAPGPCRVGQPKLTASFDAPMAATSLDTLA